MPQLIFRVLVSSAFVQTPAAIEAFQLTKVLKGRRILDEVSFLVHPGEIACLLGPNGSGKTTLIKILATVILPDGGTAVVEGRDILREARWVRSRVGWHSGEERSMYGRLSARENLLFFGALYGLGSAAARRRIKEVADRLGMSGWLDRTYQELSSGMKQRTVLARALLHDPSVILLDEPTQGLDPVAAEQLLDGIVRPLARDEGRAVLLATHHLHEAARIADSVRVLSKGRLVRTLSADDVSEDADSLMAVMRDIGAAER